MTERRFVEIPSLDGLRAVSIALVFASHVGYEAVPGGFGVTIFFVLSGYLITTLLRLEWERTRTVSISDFYIRRAFRILPAFYVVLFVAAAAAAVGVLRGGFSALPFGAQSAHIWNYFSVFHKGPQEPVPGTGVYWSLAVEEHFYLVFPLVFVVMTRRGVPYARQAAYLGAACVAVLAWRLVLVLGFDVSTDRTTHATDTRVDSLLIGCVIALAFNPRLDRVRESDRRVMWEGIVGLLMILGSLAVRSDAFRETLRYTIQSVAAGLVLRSVVHSPRTVPARALNLRWVKWFGRLSYAFYLVHLIVILGLARHIESRPLLIVTSLALSLALSWVLQRGVMDPAVRLGRRIIEARADRTASLNASHA